MKTIKFLQCGYLAARSSVLFSALIAAAGALGIFPDAAQAVPSMGRQTGMQCAACHTVFPELTSFGRQFKLRAFSLSVPKEKSSDSMFGDVPISALLQVSRNTTKNASTPGAEPEQFPRDRETIVQGAGLYYGGKITENSGGLVQYFYDGIEKKWKMEMFDVRWANSLTAAGKDLIYGFTLNNNPTLSDIYNSTPVWSFPHTETPALMPNAAAMVDMTLASKVGGPGVYGLWNDLVYGEFALYRSNKTGAFRPLGWGNERDPRVKGYAPYWRLALQKEWDSHSIAVGTYGLTTRTHLDPADVGTPTNRFRDVALDGQYQYIVDNHQFSAHATWIREKQDLNASFDAGMVSNLSNKLRTFRADAHYFYQRRWGGGVQYFQTRGNADDLRYNSGEAVMGSINGSPNNKGWMADLEYLPVQNVKLGVRYTSYSQFNGAGTNYDGFGRNAKDNNSLYLLGWFLF